MREHRSSGLIAVNLEESRRAIRHREWAAVQGRRRGKEIQPRELIDARMRSVPTLISRCNNSFRGGHPVERSPRIARLDPPSLGGS